MTPPPDLLSRSRRYVRSLRYYVRGMDDEDLVSIFYLGGFLACQGRRWSWNLFVTGGISDLRDAMTKARRMCRTPPGEVVSLDAIYNEPHARDEFSRTDAGLTIHALLARVNLTALERESIDAFLRGEREGLWAGRCLNRDRLHNAVFKAIKKLRRVAQHAESPL